MPSDEIPGDSQPDPFTEESGENASAVPNGEFLQCFTKSQRRLYVYILSLIPSPQDAEEVLQDTNLILLNKAEQYRPGTNFFAWAAQVAYFEVLKCRARKRRDKLQLASDVLELISEEAEKQSELLERRREALTECLKKLRESDRKLIQSRYAAEKGEQSLTEIFSRPANSIYQSIGRIRRTLMECISRRLASEMRM